jgi:purine-binding chemotaxis protein CheW
VALQSKLRRQNGAALPRALSDSAEQAPSLLDARAARYARAEAEPPAIERTVVTFVRNGSRYGVSLEELREIRALAHWCRLPGASNVVPGVVHYRGELLSLMDLAALSSGSSDASRASWMLVIEQAGERLGLMADEVTDVLSLEAGSTLALPLTMGSAADTFVGMTVDGVLIVDTGRLMTASLHGAG